MVLTDAEKKSLKGQGYIIYRDGVHFSARVLITAGRMNSREARKITEVCEKYGDGSFTLTQRLNVEIPWIKYQDLENVKRELAEVGLTVGGTGMRVRPVQTCKGSVCQMSFYDTEEVAKMIDERFYRGQYDKSLPNKLRIITSGCGNGCSKPRIGCIGLQGKKPNEVAISLGGRLGKESAIGRELPGLYSIPEALNICEKAIAYYRENGIQGERFAQTVERIGFEAVGSAITGLPLSEFKN